MRHILQNYTDLVCLHVEVMMMATEVSHEKAVSTDKMLTVGEAAAYLGLHPKTIRNWSDKGLLPSTKWPNKWRMFKRRDLDEMRAKLGLPAVA